MQTLLLAEQHQSSSATTMSPFHVEVVIAVQIRDGNSERVGWRRKIFASEISAAAYDMKLENSVAKIIPRPRAKIHSVIATPQAAEELTFWPAFANPLAFNQRP